jgi:hypothetical protein
LDNDGCVQLADTLRRANPGRWIQLFGNHDLAALGGPQRPAWNRQLHLCEQATATLRGWWTTGQAHLAVAVTSREYGAVLISHVGLTRGRWAILGKPNPAAAAELLNVDVGRPIHDVIRGGALTGTDAGPDGANTDIVWAEVTTELYQPWLDAGDSPFTQIHGHASPWNWTDDDWWPDASPGVRRATRVDHSVRRTTTVTAHPPGIAARTLICVDWNLGDSPIRRCWPLLTLTV